MKYLEEKIDVKLVLIGGLFVLSLVVSNLLATKLTTFFGFTLDSAVLVYPFCFMLGDVLTELWGFKIAKKVIWIGFLVQAIVVIFPLLAIYLPIGDGWNGQAHFAYVFSLAPRIVVASFAGYIVSELINSWVMDKMKKNNGKQPLWVRTIGSSVVGQVFDTILFVGIAFYGVVPLNVLFVFMISQYIFKVVIEATLGTPIAYWLIRKLK